MPEDHCADDGGAPQGAQGDPVDVPLELGMMPECGELPCSMSRASVSAGSSLPPTGSGSTGTDGSPAVGVTAIPPRGGGSSP